MSKPKVMVVDDDDRYLELLEFMLSSANYESVAVQHPRDVQSIAETERPDVIVLDIAMPELDGMEVGMKLKSEPSTADIPLIYVTAMSDSANMQEGKKIGAAYLTKPFAPQELIDTIQSVLNSGKPHGVSA